MDTETEQTRHENPRTTRVRQIVLDASIELLINHGAGEVTATNVTKETGVARTTIYRHWPNPALLLLDTIDAVVAPHAPADMTGDLKADLTKALSNLRVRMATHPFRAIFAALLDNANRDEAFATAQRRLVEGVLAPINHILTAAKERGDLPTTVDIAAAEATLAGPLFHHHIMLRIAIDDDLIAHTIHQLINQETPNDHH